MLHDNNADAGVPQSHPARRYSRSLCRFELPARCPGCHFLGEPFKLNIGLNNIRLRFVFPESPLSLFLLTLSHRLMIRNLSTVIIDTILCLSQRHDR